MPALLAFAFVAGIITILSPCILPVLPIVLAGSATGGHRRPLGIITGFVLSFTFFTLFAFAIVSILGLGADILRTVAIVILALFGLTLVIPQLSDLAKRYFSKLANINANRSPPTADRAGFGGGFIIGLSLGLIWTPCVGPIMSAVITLAATSSVSYQAALITLAYSIGTAIPMFAIMVGGRKLLSRIPWLLENTEKVQKAFGILMILIALAMTFGLDRKFQTFILDTFPSYGAGLTSIEDNETVKKQLESFGNEPGTDSPSPAAQVMDLARYPDAPNPEFTGATKWLNSEPLTLEKLKGKVILVDFWTYTCINCIRTLPYLTSWDAKYKDQGLVIIGVHSPEFAFEKEEKNVREAMKEYGIEYPVVQDNGFAIWKSYRNRYWPAKYLIDAQGRVRDTHFGEGAYEETERKIQELLKEAGMENVDKEVTKETPTERTASITPETYLGLARMERNFGRTQPSTTTTSFTDQVSGTKEEEWVIPQDSFAFDGKWSFDDERAMPEYWASLDFRVRGSDVYLVMRPKEPGKIAQVTIGLGAFDFPPQWYGKDVKEGGIVTVNEDRLYHLVHIPDQAMLKARFPGTGYDDGTYVLHIGISQEGAATTTPELYAFTFG